MRGLTVVEIAILVVILVVAAAAVFALFVPAGQYETICSDCMDNVRKLAGLLDVAAGDARAYPELGGVNLILRLVAKGELEGEGDLDVLFCPGDWRDSLSGAGGPKAYENLDLTKPGTHGHLTSYAARDLQNPKCTVRPGSGKPVVLVCDDSEDHHDGKGFVVGLTGGSVKWRDKVDDWGLELNTPVVVGPESVVAELRCMRRD